MKIKFLIYLLSFFMGLFFLTDFVFASATGAIDPVYKYAWGERIGWINFGCSGCNVRITDFGLTGHAWSANYGWINLNPTNGGVNNNGEGILSGHAWGENLGWINFDGVQINSSGVFSGIANGPVSGRISFDCAECQVRTDWRPRIARPICNNSLDDDGDGKIDYLNDPGCDSLTDTDEIDPVRGDGMLGAFAPPEVPEDGFRVLINNDVQYVDSPIVTLNLFGGSDAVRMVISNFSDFRDADQETYKTSKDWNLCKGLIFCPEGKYTVYAKFYAPWGLSSKVVSDSIIYKRKPFIERLPEILKPLVPEFLRPKPPEVAPEEIPIEELVPKEAPLSFQSKWRLLPSEPIREFVLAPLPREIKGLVQKFPGLEETLEKLGITGIADIQKLKTVKLTLPGLTEKLGLPTWRIQPGEFALPKGVPVAKLPPEIKEKIPTEVVFVKTAGELIDFNIDLTIGEKGEVQQRITTISGKPLQLVVRPDKPVESIKGYLIFKSRSPRPISFQLPFSYLTASMFFANPVFAQFQEESVKVEEWLVLMEFEYTDFDGDGIYTAEIQTPLVEGEYEIITVMNFEDPELGKREIRLITLIDPEGYIYEKERGKEIRIPGAIVSIYWLNPETKQYELWPANEYRQENPQITDVRGTYSFLVPEGLYYLEVTAPGYLEYRGKPFQVQEGRGVHINIELKPQYWWLEIVDWKTILLILATILLFYNFYRDRMREKLLKQ